VVTVSLRQPTAKPDGESDADLLVYGAQGQAKPANILAGLLQSPGAAVGMLTAAFGNMLFPGEPTRISDRLKLVVQCIAALGLAVELRKRQVQHLHCHFAHAPTTIGLYASYYLKVPFSFTGHANDLFQRRVLLKRKLQHASFVACISQWHRNLYESVEPNQSSRYQVVRCGVDTDKPGGSPVPAQSGSLRILTVARLVPKKGIDTLLKALAELRDGGTALYLRVIGDGPQAAQLKQLAGELGLDEGVVWSGSASNDQVHQAMLEADLFALPCRKDDQGDRDGIPVVLMEAMAAGLPVVSGDLPAIRELVQDGKTGLLIDGTCPHACTQALKRLADDPRLRKQLAEAGRRRVKEEFDLQVNVERLERAFVDAMQCHG
jgi:glycosyltransferase involved in cell wall biosynthesis